MSSETAFTRAQLKKLLADAQYNVARYTRLLEDTRPSNCRNRLRDEGKAYPRSGCASCGNGGLFGCRYEKP